MTDAIPKPEVWERQPGESNLWYSRLEHYRLAGPGRSLLAAVNADREQRGAKKAGSVPHAWADQAKLWRWKERAEAWDAHQRQQARAAHAKAVEEMNRRHGQEAKALQAKAFERLRSFGPEELSAADVLRYLIEASKLERTALGQPETIEEQRLTGRDGGAVIFTLEDAVQADQEVERWQHDRLQPRGGPEPSQGSPQVP